MSTVPMHLPASFSSERGKLETKILDFSNRLFKNFKCGLAFTLIFDALYIYLWYKKTPLTAIFLYFYIINILFHIIIFQCIGKK